MGKNVKYCVIKCPGRLLKLDTCLFRWTSAKETSLVGSEPETQDGLTNSSPGYELCEGFKSYFVGVEEKI